MKSKFEIAISEDDLAIRGNFTILEGKSTTGFSEVPNVVPQDIYTKSNSLIQHDQAWCVEANWKVTGPLACLLDCGYWKCEVHFEAIGGGETQLKPQKTISNQGAPGYRYTEKIQIPAYALKPGMYRVVSCLQYYTNKDIPGPIVGFKDLGLIKIYVDKTVKPTPVPTDLELAANGQA